MKQDKGIKKRIVATGALVETTGLKLDMGSGWWFLEIKYKNGKKAWFYDFKLQDI